MSDPGFVGATYTAASLTQDAQETINWYAETDPTKNSGTRALGVAGDRGVTALYPTPGLVSPIQLAYGEVRGVYPVTGGNVMMVVSSNTLYAINSLGVVSTVGTLQSFHGQVSMSDNGASVYIADGNNRYTCSLTGTNFAQIASTDGAFQGADKCGIVDSFIFYNNPGTSQWGCTNVLSTVSGNTNFASMIGSPNNIVTLFGTNREVLLLGEIYSEWWINVNAFPFPFGIIPGTSMQHGCAAKYSPARLGETFSFLARDDRGQNIVVQMVGYSPKRISTFAVEQAISKYNTVSDAIGMSYQQSGHEFYILTFPSADVTWVYDLASDMWHKRSWIDTNGVRHRHRANCCAAFQGKTFVGDWQNGMLYQFSQSVYTDNGNPIRCVRRATHLTADLKRVFYNSLQLQFQPGVGLSGNASASGENYLSLPGTVGNYASTPDSSKLDVTGDIDIAVRLSLVDWTPASAGVVLAKSVTGTSQASFAFIVLTNGTLILQTSPNGTAGAIVNGTSTVAPTVVNGQTIWIGVTLDVDDGSGNRVYNFYTAPDQASIPSVWTQLGATVTTAGTTSIFNSTSPLEIGSINNGTATLLACNVYQAVLYNGIGGPIAALFNPTQIAAGTTSFTSPNAETYTINGTAAITGNFVPATLGADPQAMLKWSDDGGFTWSNEHWVSLGKQGAYKNRALWRQLGQARDRIFEVAVTDPVYRVLVSAELDATPGAH